MCVLSLCDLCGSQNIWLHPAFLQEQFYCSNSVCVTLMFMYAFLITIICGSLAFQPSLGREE